jgi:long-chain acyl-CoA synthetase
MKSLHERIRALVDIDSQKPAILVCDENGAVIEEISRADLIKKINQAGAYLFDAGLRAGDKVALSFHNSADLLILSWSAWACGIVTVPLDMKRDTAEMRDYKINASGAKLHLSQEEFQQQKEKSCPDIKFANDLSHTALILFTSGTTAYPKGAVLTLENLVVNAESIEEWLKINEDDRFLVELPLHHINSTTFCLASLLAGASIAIPPAYSNSRFWEQVARSGATITSIVPSIIFDQLHNDKEYEEVRQDIKLTRIQLGSAPVVSGDALAFIKKFSIPLYQGYGQTETALRVTGVPMNLPPALYEKLVEENSIGCPLSWADVEITDSAGNILGEKKEGELVVQGPAVMQGYVGGEPTFRNGWFLTGDIGFWKEIDGMRFFFLIGRSKEIIIKGGVNISPVAVENAMKNIDADIDSAYVVGVNDERYGEEVGAVIVWKSGIDECAAMRRLKFLLLAGHKTLSEYETPKYLVSVRSEELPTTSTGKVQRIVLRKNLGGTFESLYKLISNDDFVFEIIASQSPFAETSHALYNHCWRPLTKNKGEYKKYLNDYLTIGAIDKAGALTGQISFSYAENKLTCVSICSALYKPKAVPVAEETPNVETVRRYLLAGKDQVMNFHTKLGAKLIEVIPNGRPEDKSSLGYTILLKYSPLKTDNLSGKVSNQLIQAVRILAKDVGAEVYAVSRPGGLAYHMSKGV